MESIKSYYQKLFDTKSINRKLLSIVNKYGIDLETPSEKEKKKVEKENEERIKKGLKPKEFKMSDEFLISLLLDSGNFQNPMH